MKLITLFSIFCLGLGSLIANPSIDILRQQHLETSEGRASFLTDKLTRYTAAADQLNHEIQALAQEIQTLSAEADQPQILALSEEMTQKINQLLPMLPVLEMALSANDDLQQIDLIMYQTDPLSPEQQEIVDRVAALCRSVGE